MLQVIGYTKEIRIFRHRKKEVWVAIYKELGKGASQQKPKSKELKRET